LRHACCGEFLDVRRHPKIEVNLTVGELRAVSHRRGAAIASVGDEEKVNRNIRQFEISRIPKTTKSFAFF
jgi:hypothetical protein